MEAEKEEKIQHLKNLLVKQKKQSDWLKQKLEEQGDQLDKLQQEKKAAEEMVQHYLSQDDPRPPPAQDIQKVLAHISLQGVDWLCVKHSNKLEWLRKERIQGVDTLRMPTNIDYEEQIEKQESHTQAQQDIANIIVQYETRLKKLNEVYESTESQLKNSLDQNKAMQSSQEDSINRVNEFASTLVDSSEQIMQNTFLRHSDEQDIESQAHYEQQLALCMDHFQSLSPPLGCPALQAQKEHLNVMHQTLDDYLQQITKARIETRRTEERSVRAQQTYDREKQSLIIEKQTLIESGRKKIATLQAEIDELRQESRRSLKEKELQIEFLQKEMKKNINTTYVKNILMKFINGDLSVQEKTLPVITTVLQFTPEEAQLFVDQWRQSKHPLSSTYNSLSMLFRK